LGWGGFGDDFGFDELDPALAIVPSRLIDYDVSIS
jgi:hypothetical protein